MWSTVSKLVAGVLVTLGCGVPGMAQGLNATGRQSGMFSSRSIGSGSSAVQHQWLTADQSGQVAAGADRLGGRGRQRTGYRQTGAFVGADRQELESFFERFGQVSRDDFRSFRRQRQRPEQPAPNDRGTQRTGSGAPVIRTRLRIAFDYPQPLASETIEALAKHLGRLARTGATAPIGLQVRNGTATLQGVVASEHDRRLAEQLVQLQPGIQRVRNEVVVEAVPAQRDGLRERPPLEEPE